MLYLIIKFKDKKVRKHFNLIDDFVGTLTLIKKVINELISF